MKIFVFNGRKALNLLIILTGVLTLIVFTSTFSSQIVEVFTKTSSCVPIYSVETSQKKVALTFDCAWGADDISNIMDTLKKENVKASFFLVGEWIKKFPKQSKEIAEAGHDIANHSDSHMKMSQLSSESIRSDLLSANNLIERLTGQKCFLYRAPYGDYDERLIKIAKEQGQYVIQWDVDSLDWKNISSENIITRVMGKVKNGSIILLHNDTKYTASTLQTLIKELKKQGYTIVPVSELIYKDNYYIDYEGRQHAK